METQTLSIKQYQHFQITLYENKTTGYSWTIDTSSGIKLVSDEYVVTKQNSKILGRGGSRILEFVPTNNGLQYIICIYKRIWEKPSKLDKTKKYVIKVYN